MGYGIVYLLGVATGLVGPATVAFYRKVRHQQGTPEKKVRTITEPILDEGKDYPPGPPIMSRISFRNVPGRRSGR